MVSDQTKQEYLAGLHAFIVKIINMNQRCDITNMSLHQPKGINLLNSTFSLNQSRAFLNIPVAAEEMLRQSLNMSYIGQMSGKRQDLHRIKFEQIEEPIFTTRQEKQERLNFSQLKVEEASEHEESSVKSQDTKLAYIRSFSKDQQDLYGQSGCMMCSSNEPSGKCRLQLQNQSSLQIYKSSKQGVFDNLLLAFNFDTITARVHFDSIPLNRQIEIIAGKYRVVIELDNQKIAEWWYGKLSKMINQSKGHQVSLTTLLDREDSPFYKERFQTENFFFNHCETGDILLFQDDHFFAKAQRFFTRSDFDHVGMVIKDLNYGILIFEANSGSGVSLTPWKYVVKFDWYKTIPKISWRRLMNVNKNQEFNSIIQKFVISNLEKHYHISFAKITAQQSILRKPSQTKRSQQGQAQQSKETEAEETGFFCSELVATIYKELSLLTRDTSNPNYQPACKFYPKDFSQKSGRKLDKGELSHEYTLYFDDALLKQTYSDK